MLDGKHLLHVQGMGKFCDAILDYLANMDKATDKRITAEMYYGEMYSTFDVMFSVWLLTKEAKVCVDLLADESCYLNPYMLHIASSGYCRGCWLNDSPNVNGATG